MPGLEAVRGLINPSYQRMNDAGMVTLREKITFSYTSLISIGQSERVGFQGTSCLVFICKHVLATSLQSNVRCCPSFFF